MLSSEGDLVRKAASWYSEPKAKGPHCPVPEDVLVSALVVLRCIGAETYDMCKGRTDLNRDLALSTSNQRITEWMDYWHDVMDRAGGQMFHFSILCLHRLHARLYLNRLGLQPARAYSSNSAAITMCHSSAEQCFLIINRELATSAHLQFAHELVSTITAFAAIFMLRLHAVTAGLVGTDSQTSSHSTLLSRSVEMIMLAANAFQEHSDPASHGGHQSRFLRYLISSDLCRSAEAAAANADANSRLQNRRRSLDHPSPFRSRRAGSTSPSPPPSPTEHGHLLDQYPGYAFPATPEMPAHPMAAAQRDAAGNEVRSMMQLPPQMMENDRVYWKKIFSLIGFGPPTEVRESF